MIYDTNTELNEHRIGNNALDLPEFQFPAKAHAMQCIQMHFDANVGGRDSVWNAAQRNVNETNRARAPLHNS